MLSLRAARLLAASLSSKSKPRKTPTALAIAPLAALEPLPSLDKLSLKPMGKKSHYAVVRGRAPGIYRSWDDCAAQVQGFRDNLYKGFGSELEATRFLEQHGIEVSSNPNVPPLGRSSLPTTTADDVRRQQATQKNNTLPSINYSNSLEEEEQYEEEEREAEEEAEKLLLSEKVTRIPLPDTTATTKTATAPTALKTLVPPGSTARMQFDGASKRNPGPAALGAVLYDAETGFEVGTVKAYMGDYFTNNQAEYAGLIAGLQAAHEMGYDSIEVQGDSTLIVNQVLGTWRVKNEGLMPYHQVAVAMKKKFKLFRAKQVPRAENAVADALGNEAIREWNEGVGGERWTLEKARAAAAGAGAEKREDDDSTLSGRSSKKQKLK
jgi:ribonuclease HI